MRNRFKVLAVVLALCLVVGSLYAEYVPKVVKLNYLERIIVGNLLPKEASFMEWKILNDLKNQLAPTEEETKAVDLKQLPKEQGSGVTANWDAVQKDITFGEVSERWVVDALTQLDRQKKLLPEQLSVYEKFVVNKKE